jgi:hypothetical protein
MGPPAAGVAKVYWGREICQKRGGPLRGKSEIRSPNETRMTNVPMNMPRASREATGFLIRARANRSLIRHSDFGLPVYTRNPPAVHAMYAFFFRPLR